MSTPVRARARISKGEDGLRTLTITVTGLTEAEAWAMGSQIGDPLKIAMIKSVRDRLTPASYIVDNRFTPEDSKP